MSSPTLHYIYDPLCGWCYAAAPLLKAARAVLPVQAHAGGMMSGANRQQVTPQLRSYVMTHDQRIAQMTGQPFGEAYFEGLLRDSSAVFDSDPPIAAILAAEQLAGRGLDMLAQLQRAHYVDGLKIADAAVLQQQAQQLGLDQQRFPELYQTILHEQLASHVSATRRLMQQLGARGFPSIALEHKGQWQMIDLSAYLSEPAAFADWLRQQLPQQAAATANAADPAAANGWQCGPDSCSVGQP